MLVAGFDTENLVMLAGEMEPFDQIEIRQLADKIFKELGLTWDNNDVVQKNYTCYLIREALAHKRNLIQTLSIIKDFCEYYDDDDPYYNFYVLYYTYDDLIYGEHGYWPNAHSGNIIQIIIDYCKTWLQNCE